MRGWGGGLCRGRQLGSGRAGKGRSANNRASASAPADRLVRRHHGSGNDGGGRRGSEGIIACLPRDHRHLRASARRRCCHGGEGHHARAIAVRRRHSRRRRFGSEDVKDGRGRGASGERCGTCAARGRDRQMNGSAEARGCEMKEALAAVAEDRVAAQLVRGLPARDNGCECPLRKVSAGNPFTAVGCRDS